MKSTPTNYRLHTGIVTLISVALALLAALFVYLLAGFLPLSLRKIDLTSKKVSELTETAKKFIAEINEPIRIYPIAVAGSEDPVLSTFLERIDGASERITVEWIDPAVRPGLIRQYSDEDLPDNSVIVASSKRSRILQNYEFYRFTVTDEQNGKPLGEFSYNDFYTMLTNYSAYFSAGVYSYEQLFSAENSLVSALNYVTSDILPSVGLLGGHGERDLPDGLLTALSLDNLQVETLLLTATSDIPKDVDCIVLHAPTSDLSEHEASLLSDYLESGGDLIVLTDANGARLERLSTLLGKYGLTAGHGYLYESDADNYLSYEDYVLGRTASAESYLGLGSYAAAFVDAHPIYYPEDSETLPEHPISYVSLFTTSEEGRFHPLETSEDNVAKEEDTEDPTDGKGSYNMGVLASDGRSHIIWISSSYFLDENVNSSVAGGNHIYFTALLESLCGMTDSISIESKAMVEDSLVITTAQAIFWSVLLVGLLPITILIPGASIARRRKRRL